LDLLEMTILHWPEWLPDAPDFQNAGSPRIKNCVPLTAKSYGPMPTWIAWSSNALSERAQGLYSIKGGDSTVYLFAGDRTKLYMSVGGDRALTDVSLAGGYDTPSVDSGGYWSFTSFGDRVIATNGNDKPQTLVLPPGGTPAFADLSPDAPTAKYVAVVKDFLMFGNTFDGVDGVRPSRVWWSGINSPAYWPVPGSVPAVQTQSDFQDLQQTDLGAVTGLVSGFAPGSDVAIFCEKGIWTAAYVGGQLIFNFKVAQGAAGTLAPLSIVQSFAKDNTGAIRPVVYYLSSAGFAAFDGSTSFAVGAQKFDRAFYNMLDDAHLNYVQGVADPRTRSVMWGIPTPGSGGLFTHVLIYNWELGRASLSEMEAAANHAEFLGQVATVTAYNLDNIDSFGTVDTISPPFDDPFWSGNASSRVGLFTVDHKLAIGGGPAMAPILETPEMQPAEGRRAWVQMTRPLIDGGAATIAVGHRERQTDPVIWEVPVAINAIGECPQRCTGRYIRFRLQMPAGQQFNHLAGIDLTVVPEAKRR
jgi:hypothetical protein